MEKRILAFILAILMLLAVKPVTVDAFQSFSGYAYYPETYISSPDGQITPDLESLYLAWAENMRDWGYNDSREDFFASIESNNYLKGYYDYETDTYIESEPVILSGLTFQQAAEKLANEKPREWQYIVRCATHGMELNQSDILIYTMNIFDTGKLIDGKLRITIESVRQGIVMSSFALKPIKITTDGKEISVATYSEGQLWSDFYELSEEELNRIIEYRDGDELLDSPMSATRTYTLPVTAGINEFIINDGLNTFKLIVNVASPLTATPTASTVLVNGEEAAFDAYTINQNNYFKLRDLAYVLNGTEKQFEVGYDNATKAITLTGGQSYTANGSEMISKGAGDKIPEPSASKIYLDGTELELTVYTIGGNNYFKLRDIGKALDFNVSWDGARNTIVINTGENYSDD